MRYSPCDFRHACAWQRRGVQRRASSVITYGGEERRHYAGRAAEDGGAPAVDLETSRIDDVPRGGGTSDAVTRFRSPVHPVDVPEESRIQQQADEARAGGRKD